MCGIRDKIRNFFYKESDLFVNEITHRTKTRPVKVGNLTIGGNNELIIQSMTTTKTHDVEATVAEIKRLEEAGCQIVRVAVPDERVANAIADIKKAN